MSSLKILYFQLLQVPVPPTFLSKSWSHCWKVAPEGGYVKACRVITIPYRIHVDYTFPSGDGGCCCCCCGWESSTWISRISKRSSNATETPGHWADELRDCFAAANKTPMIPWTPNETPSQLHEVVEVLTTVGHCCLFQKSLLLSHSPSLERLYIYNCGPYRIPWPDRCSCPVILLPAYQQILAETAACRLVTKRTCTHGTKQH